jgi:hypothetical protein
MFLCLVTLFSLSVATSTARSFLTAPIYPAGGEASFVAAGDFNGDGILDLVAVNGGTYANPYSDSGVSILLGNGDGSFQAPQSYAIGGFLTAVAIADFNGDGHLDLVVANYNSGGTVSVLLGNGDGTFQAPQDFPAGLYPVSVAVGDFNGDGIPDLAVANFGAAHTASILLGNGDGTFQAPQSYPVGDMLIRSIVVADFNGDGHLDVAVALDYYDGPVILLLGNGDGTFQAARTVPTGNIGDQPNFLVVGDFNSDGIPDLVVGGLDGPVIILLGNGDGTFWESFTYPLYAFSYMITAIGAYDVAVRRRA